VQHVHVEVNVRQEAATSFDALPPELFMRIVAESLCAGAGAAPSFRLVNKTWMGAHDGASRKLRLTLRSSADPDDSAFHPAAVHPLKLPSLLQQFGCLRTLNLVRCPTSGRTSGPTAPRPPPGHTGTQAQGHHQGGGGAGGAQTHGGAREPPPGTYSDGQDANRTTRVWHRATEHGPGRRDNAPTLSRCTYSPRYGLHSCSRDHPVRTAACTRWWSWRRARWRC
jgi:hypothetical protein